MRASTLSRETVVDDAASGSRSSARVLIGCVLCLLMLGLLMLFSTGIGHSNPLHYPVRQGAFAVVALIAALVTARMPYTWWRPLLLYLFPVTVILLVMVRLVGLEINGSHRWLTVGPVNFQPSELGKLTAVIWLAAWMSHVQGHSSEFFKGFLLPVTGLGVISGLVIIEPDFGTAILIGMAGVTLMFIAGTRFGYLLLTSIVGSGGVILAVMQDPERLSRITTFLNPDRYESDESYQLMHSLYAFIEGGLKGVGFGQSLQKYSYLPEAHTDFILAIIGEELGVFGTLFVLFLFFVFFLSGMRIGWQCNDSFGRLLAYGITLLISLQACINVGVVTASMPTKGLPLPFVSYGGSSLVFMSAMVGILIRIAYSEGESSRNRSPARDSRHWV